MSEDMFSDVAAHILICQICLHKPTLLCLEQTGAAEAF